MHAKRVLGSAEPQRSVQCKGCAEVLKAPFAQLAWPRQRLTLQLARGETSRSKARAAPRLRVRVEEKLSSRRTCALPSCSCCWKSLEHWGGVKPRWPGATSLGAAWSLYGWRTNVRWLIVVAEEHGGSMIAFSIVQYCFSTLLLKEDSVLCSRFSVLKSKDIQRRRRRKIQWMYSFHSLNSRNPI